ncbi:MAG: T9SS type A sorting domain-containing protein [Bacteroidales bacterium]|nr:T9SS type A sorting domain-containing protein [Bacteroidales bacterium]
MRRLLAIRLLIIAIAAMVCVPPVGAARTQPARWEVVETDSSDEPADQSGDRVEVSARGGYIYVTTRREINVKVFTILGQLVSQGRLPAGTSRLRVANKGIYILKTGSYTCRVTI